MNGVWGRAGALTLLATFVLLPACGGRTAGTTPPLHALQMDTPKSISPASIPAPPMARTTVLPSSAMSSRTPKSAVMPPSWTQLPGGAIAVAASPDGSIWVLSNQGGADRSIWHYVNGNWTNIPGAASRLAAAPDNTLWVVNSSGGIYHWNGSAWNTIAGGASDISVGADGTVYVISNQNTGFFGRAIYHYVNGTWTQLQGAAVRVAANWDTGTYPGGIAPGGFYVINAQNSVFYFNPSTGFTQLPGGVLQVAATKSGGLFALGYIQNPDGSSPIYYNDLSTGSWTQEPGAAVSIATDGAHVYAVGAAGGIYSSPVTPNTTSQAPAVGYLTPTSTGSFAGTLGNITNGTAVAISTTEVNDDGSPLSHGSLNFLLGSSVLNAERQTSADIRPPVRSGPQPVIDGPTEGPAEMAALQRKLRPISGARQALSYRRTSSLPTTVGSPNTFWVSVFSIGSSSGTDVQVPATLEFASTYGYVWIDNTLLTNSAFSGANLATNVAQIGADLDNAYLSNTTHFGATGFTAGAPGMTNGNQTGWQSCDTTGTWDGHSGVPLWVVPPDSKVNAFVINASGLGQGVGGYFTSTNYIYQSAFNCLIGQTPSGGGLPYTLQTIPHSNEAPMVYVGYQTAAGYTANFEINEDLVRGIAHEMQHDINFVNHVLLHGGSNENRWINEGMSMVAQDLAVQRKFGLAHDSWDALYHASQFTSAPQNFSLTAFAGIDPGQSTVKYNCSGCYGAEYLFQRYLYDRFGGDTYFRAMLGGTTDYAALQAATGVDPHTLISDFAIALAASGTGTTSDPRFGIPSLNLLTAYPDQFGTSQTVGGPARTSLPSSASPFVGSFAYYSLGPSASNQNLSGKDVTGTFGFKLGVVQR